MVSQHETFVIEGSRRIPRLPKGAHPPPRQHAEAGDL